MIFANYRKLKVVILQPVNFIYKLKLGFMFPFGAIIGLAGQAASGALSIFNNRRMQQEADAEAARQNAYYEAKANENPLSRSENQHLLGQYDRNAQQQIENARSMAAITGATPEFTTAVQKGVAEGRANLMGQMAAGASARADYYNNMGERARHQKAQEDMQRRMQRNSTYAALAGNAASAVGAIMDGYSAKAPETPQRAPHPSVIKEEQRKINTSLAQIGDQAKQDNGLLTNPGVDYDYLKWKNVASGNGTGRELLPK